MAERRERRGSFDSSVVTTPLTCGAQASVTIADSHRALRNVKHRTLLARSFDMPRDKTRR